MNEIKFRAWDEENKLMVYSDNQPYWYEWEINEHHGVICMHFDYVDDDFGGNVYYGEHLPIMQYTCIKDKNGKEIYAGDVVKDDWGRIMEVVFNKEKAKFQFRLIRVEGEHAHWANNFVWADMTDWFENGKNYVEVIGNVYENGGLLNEN